MRQQLVEGHLALGAHLLELALEVGVADAAVVAGGQHREVAQVVQPGLHRRAELAACFRVAIVRLLRIEVLDVPAAEAGGVVREPDGFVELVDVHPHQVAPVGVVVQVAAVVPEQVVHQAAVLAQELRAVEGVVGHDLAVRLFRRDVVVERARLVAAPPGRVQPEQLVRNAGRRVDGVAQGIDQLPGMQLAREAPLERAPEVALLLRERGAQRVDLAEAHQRVRAFAEGQDGGDDQRLQLAFAAEPGEGLQRRLELGLRP